MMEQNIHIFYVDTVLHPQGAQGPPGGIGPMGGVGEKVSDSPIQRIVV